MKHTLKCWPRGFWAVVAGNKTHEWRWNDRDYKIGDRIDLREYGPGTREFSGRSVEVLVTHCTYGPSFGIPEGYVVMSIRRLP